MWLEKKYISLISNRLDRFKRTTNDTFNFRCPLCGDSTTSKSKARGYLYNKQTNYVFHCHNCGETLAFRNLLKIIDQDIYDDYLKESLAEKFVAKKERDPIIDFRQPPPVFANKEVFSDLKKISSLPHDHLAKQYITSRRIPNEYHANLYYAPQFKKFVNTIIPRKFYKTDNDEKRIIIPFFDENKQLIGFQGRAVDNSMPKYYTLMLNEDKPKVFNLDRCDINKPYYIVEGPFDSMFVENSIAMVGSSIPKEYVNENAIFVYDNEPRSREISKKIRNKILAGNNVVIFPEWIESKDINDMVLSDIDISSVLSQNISNGLEAMLIFTLWKKVQI